MDTESFINVATISNRQGALPPPSPNPSPQGRGIKKVETPQDYPLPLWGGSASTLIGYGIPYYLAETTTSN